MLVGQQDAQCTSDEEEWDPPTEFANMFSKVIQLLDESAEVDELKNYVRFLTHPRTLQPYVPVKLYEHCNTPGQILEALYPQYINFMNTHLLRIIVHKFGDDKSKSLVKRYEDHFPRNKPLKRMRDPLTG